jgi:hypothetical protein
VVSTCDKKRSITGAARYFWLLLAMSALAKITGQYPRHLGV